MASSGKTKKMKPAISPLEGSAVAPVKTPSSVSEWRAANGQPVMSLPSGMTIKLRRIPLTDLLGSNIFPDEMTAEIQKKIAKATDRGMPSDHKKKADDEINPASFMKNEDDFKDMMAAIDKVVAMSAVEPPVMVSFEETEGDDGKKHRTNIAEENRNSDYLYTDEMDLTDKMEIFSFAIGGNSNLKTFH